MNTTQRKIVVSVYAAAVVKPSKERRAQEHGTTATARIRQRWKAEFIEKGQVRDYVDGHLTYDDAIGALIRQMVQKCESADEVFDLIAGLFSDPTKRSPEVSMSRAVWIAARARFRRNPGLTVEFPECVEFVGHTKATLRSPSPAKGGAA